MDEDEEVLTAIVCEFDDNIFRVNRAQALIFATCMFISVPVNYFFLLLLSHIRSRSRRLHLSQPIISYTHIQNSTANNVEHIHSHSEKENSLLLA